MVALGIMYILCGKALTTAILTFHLEKMIIIGTNIVV